MANKLLLHICCGPCSMYPLSRLIPQYGQENIVGLYHNPNIHPMEEFVRRRENAESACEHYGIDMVATEDFLMDKWAKYGPEENKLRCRMCYDLRLDYAAKYAMENGFDAFTTTLLVSLWQDHDYIVKKCNELAEKYSISFHYEDYREGYRQGQQMAKEIGLYRQRFCGCMWSAPEELREKLLLRYNGRDTL